MVGGGARATQKFRPRAFSHPTPVVTAFHVTYRARTLPLDSWRPPMTAQSFQRFPRSRARSLCTHCTDRVVSCLGNSSLTTTRLFGPLLFFPLPPAQQQLVDTTTDTTITSAFALHYVLIDSSVPAVRLSVCNAFDSVVAYAPLNGAYSGKALRLALSKQGNRYRLLLENHLVTETVAGASRWMHGVVNLQDLSGKGCGPGGSQVLISATIDYDHGVHFWPGRSFPGPRVTNLTSKLSYTTDE